MLRLSVPFKSPRFSAAVEPSKQTFLAAEPQRSSGTGAADPIAVYEWVPLAERLFGQLAPTGLLPTQQMLARLPQELSESMDLKKCESNLHTEADNVSGVYAIEYGWCTRFILRNT